MPTLGSEDGAGLVDRALELMRSTPGRSIDLTSEAPESELLRRMMRLPTPTLAQLSPTVTSLVMQHLGPVRTVAMLMELVSEQPGPAADMAIVQSLSLASTVAAAVLGGEEGGPLVESLVDEALPAAFPHAVVALCHPAKVSPSGRKPNSVLVVTAVFSVCSASETE
jgi:hypothetical protein